MGYAGQLRKILLLLLLVYEGLFFIFYHDCFLMMELRLGVVPWLTQGHSAAIGIFALCLNRLTNLNSSNPRGPHLLKLTRGCPRMRSVASPEWFQLGVAD